MERQRFQAELIRQQTYILVNLQLPRNGKIKKPTELWKFPWDDFDEVVLPELNEETKKRINELAKLL